MSTTHTNTAHITLQIFHNTQHQALPSAPSHFQTCDEHTYAHAYYEKCETPHHGSVRGACGRLVCSNWCLPSPKQGGACTAGFCGVRALQGFGGVLLKGFGAGAPKPCKTPGHNTHIHASLSIHTKAWTHIHTTVLLRRSASA